MRKRKILKYIIIGSYTIGVIMFLVGMMGQYQSGQSNEIRALTLKDYPEVFSKDVIIVVGKNATEIERESAVMIKENLKELTGYEPIIKNDPELLESDKRSHNLILLGTPLTNSILQEIYEVTDATRVTNEYPGVNKGILEILRNPWNSDKTLLVLTGSNKWGVRIAVTKLIIDCNKLNKEIEVVKSISETDAERWIVSGTRTIVPEFSFLSYEKEIGVSLEFETIEKGFFSGVTERKKLIIKTQERWQNLWNEHTSIRLPHPEVPIVDLRKKMIFAVFMGQKPSGGFAIRIAKVKEYKDEVIVSFIEVRPPPDTLVIQVLTQPCHIVKIEKTNLPIRFKKIKGSENESQK